MLYYTLVYTNIFTKTISQAKSHAQKEKKEEEREIVLDMQMIKQYGYVKCCFNFRCNQKWPERCYKI